ncbi:polysaccharide deacetylase [Adhaeribacter aerolatus]|uniref:Polysaccharide deacetylase n=1 Tax=Adhaeribacter aerolatus TaxID=670289 RepID=A0A512AV71_9BACT|nr:polysaccharide deacetylase family protein [Adhaeribacter aerolatus]GEO03614.1 polysaccharide deacetylase [Adhaeribacter aerolatus]
MRIFKTPSLVKKLLPGLIWDQSTRSDIIYLTFDDGPVPEYTPFVLNQLALYGALGTFFCVGDNLRKYPDIARQVAAAGHTLANHTYHHLKGWQTPTAAYLTNIRQCQEELGIIVPVKKNKLFRPPYGKLTRSQYNLLKSDYQIIMWDVLTYDFDNKLTPAACLHHAIKNTRPGSIVVFHDSQKAGRNMQFVLPQYLAHFTALGYRFGAL